MSQCVPIICRIYESSPFYFDRTARAELKWSGSSNEIFISESNKTLHVHMIWADGNMTNTFVEYRKKFFHPNISKTEYISVRKRDSSSYYNNSLLKKRVSTLTQTNALTRTNADFKIFTGGWGALALAPCAIESGQPKEPKRSQTKSRPLTSSIFENVCSVYTEA